MSFIHSFLAGSGRADNLILVVVSAMLLTIVWQAIGRLEHRRALSKWQRDLFYAMAEGLELEVTARPKITDAVALSVKWKRDVQLWIVQTGTMLERHSAQAGISFRYANDPAPVLVNGPPGPAEYKTLVVRLRNLREIIEHPDAYL